MMKAILILFFFLFLIGCNSVITHQSVQSQSSGKLEVVGEPQAWLEIVLGQVEQVIDLEGIPDGEAVKLDVTLKQDGYVESIDVPETTGNKSFEQACIASIISAEPFEYPDVTQEEKDKLSRLIFKIRS